MRVSMWKVLVNFKIKSHNDVKRFLNESLINDSEYHVFIDYDELITIKKDANGKIEVGIKYGDLYNPFNPVLIVPEDMIIKELFTYRKYLNYHFFREEV